MILFIYNPSTGRILYKKRIRYSHKLLADNFANEYAKRLDREIYSSPDNSGDFRVEFRVFADIPAWPKARSYYFKPITT